MKHCDKCPKTFKNNHGLSVHKRRMHSPKGNWVSTPPRAGKVQRRRKKFAPPIGFQIRSKTEAEPFMGSFSEVVDYIAGQRRDLPMVTETLFLWFLLRRGAKVKGPHSHSVPALCHAVSDEILKMEKELEAAKEK